MESTTLSRAAVFGRGAAVLAGWYTLGVVAFLFWLTTVPGDEVLDDLSCGRSSCGWSPRDGVMLAVTFVGWPALVVSFLVALTVVAWATVLVRVRSVLFAGTAAAAVGGVVFLVVAVTAGAATGELEWFRRMVA